MHEIISTILAQVPAGAPGDDPVAWVLEMLKWVIDQFHQGNYLPAISGVVMVLIAAFHKFFEDRIEKKWLPLVSAGVGVLAAVALNLLGLKLGSTNQDILHAVSTGLMVGTGASGFYSLAGKAIMERLFQKKEMPAPATPQDQPPAPPAPPANG